MARGFDSKSVESQQADREAALAERAAGPQPTGEEAARLSRRRTLELARTRAMADLQTACRPGHKAMLEAAIASLDKQLREMGQ